MAIRKWCCKNLNIETLEGIMMNIYDLNSILWNDKTLIYMFAIRVKTARFNKTKCSKVIGYSRKNPNRKDGGDMEFPGVLKKEHVGIPPTIKKEVEFPSLLKKNLGLVFWPLSFQARCITQFCRISRGERFGNLVVKSKLPPWSGSSLEAVEPHP